MDTILYSGHQCDRILGIVDEFLMYELVSWEKGSRAGKSIEARGVGRLDDPIGDERHFL